MLNLKFIQENKETVIERLAVKNFDAREAVEKIIELDNLRRTLQQEAEAKQAEMNRTAKAIGQLMQSGQKEEAEQARRETAELKNAIAGMNDRRNEVGAELNALLLRLPNMPHASVRPGKSEADNEIVKVVENIPQKHGDDLPHWELAKKYDLIDFETGVKITGAGFPLYKGLGARADQLFPGREHQGGLPGGAAAPDGERGFGLRHGTIAGQGRADVLRERG